ncbi:hypothetical protein HDU76_002402 [Blyttiomyces sp. JEL0837]|nr:hypothetical protein HDU76_002402 [Blyttiomyces sp. JEL0837]
MPLSLAPPAATACASSPLPGSAGGSSSPNAPSPIPSSTRNGGSKSSNQMRIPTLAQDKKVLLKTFVQVSPAMIIIDQVLANFAHYRLRFLFMCTCFLILAILLRSEPEPVVIRKHLRKRHHAQHHHIPKRTTLRDSDNVNTSSASASGDSPSRLVSSVLLDDTTSMMSASAKNIATDTERSRSKSRESGPGKTPSAKGSASKTMASSTSSSSPLPFSETKTSHSNERIFPPSVTQSSTKSPKLTSKLEEDSTTPTSPIEIIDLTKGSEDQDPDSWIDINGTSPTASNLAAGINTSGSGRRRRSASAPSMHSSGRLTNGSGSIHDDDNDDNDSWEADMQRFHSLVRKQDVKLGSLGGGGFGFGIAGGGGGVGGGGARRRTNRAGRRISLSARYRNLQAQLDDMGEVIRSVDDSGSVWSGVSRDVNIGNAVTAAAGGGNASNDGADRPAVGRDDQSDGGSMAGRREEEVVQVEDGSYKLDLDRICGKVQRLVDGNCWKRVVTDLSIQMDLPFKMFQHRTAFHCLLFVTEVPCVYERAFEFLSDPSCRPMWDELCQSSEIVETIDMATRIQHSMFLSPALNNIGKPCDVVVLFHRRDLPDGRKMNFAISVDHPNIPPREGYDRVKMNLIGLVVGPGKKSRNHSRVAYLANFKPDSKLTPETLRQIAHRILPRSIQRLQKVLTDLGQDGLGLTTSTPSQQVQGTQRPTSDRHVPIGSNVASGSTNDSVAPRRYKSAEIVGSSSSSARSAPGTAITNRESSLSAPPSVPEELQGYAVGSVEFEEFTRLMARRASENNGTKNGPSNSNGFNNETTAMISIHRFSGHVEALVSDFLENAESGRDSNVLHPWVPLVVAQPGAPPPAVEVFQHRERSQAYRVFAILENEPALVLYLCADLRARPDWDETCESVKLLERLDSQTAILHVLLRGSASSDSTQGVIGRDIVLLYHVRPLQGNRMLNVTTSVDHPDAPDGQPGYIRSFSNMVGIIVGPSPDGNPYCSTLIQITDDEPPKTAGMPVPSRSMLTLMASKALPLSIKRLNQVVASISVPDGYTTSRCVTGACLDEPGHLFGKGKKTAT